MSNPKPPQALWQRFVHWLDEKMIGSSDDEFEAAIRVDAEKRAINKERVDRAIKAWRNRD